MSSPLLVPLEGFESPGVHNFDLPPIIPGLSWFDRPLLLAIISVILVAVFWITMSRKTALVPSKGQYVGEATYSFIRDGVARDQIGHDFRKFLPYLLAVFSFVLVNNLWGVFPLTLFPTASHVGWAYGLALVSWVIYNGVGIMRHGPLGYLKRSVLPAGVPPALWLIVIPIEFASNILIRPVTLALRLFANMFAGHLLVLVFVLGGEYLLLHSEPIINKVAGGFSLIFSLAILGLEIFVEAFQAYIFTVLSAQYIGSALAEEH